MNTHTVILKCTKKKMPDPMQFKTFICDELKDNQIYYFGRNGKKISENQPALMEDGGDTVYIKVSFRHLLKLEIKHAFAVIKEALKRGFITKMQYDDHEIQVLLH